MSVTNRNGGKTGLGEALMATGLPVCFIDPTLGVGVVSLGAVIYISESMKDQNNRSSETKSEDQIKNSGQKERG